MDGAVEEKSGWVLFRALQDLSNTVIRECILN